MKKSVNNCIGYIGQTQTNHDFRNIGKFTPSKIETFVEISMLFYDMVNRPTSGDLNPIFDTDFSRRVRCYQFQIFYISKKKLKYKAFSFIFSIPDPDPDVKIWRSKGLNPSLYVIFHGDFEKQH